VDVAFRIVFVLMLLLLAGLPATAAAAPARSAGAFMDSVGVNTHVIYDDTAYGDFDRVRARLAELGVRHIRDSVCGTCVWQWERYEALAADGIRLNAGAGWPTESSAVRTQVLAAMRRLAPMIDSIEGANEWDLFSGRTSTWASETRAHQSWWHDAIRADPVLRRLPLVGPSLVFSWEAPSSWTKLGDVSSLLDYGNSHGYAGGLPPELVPDAELPRARLVSGEKPVIQTEGGYHNALGQTNWDHPAVPEDVAGVYMPRMFLENFRRGIARTYSYELLDEWPGHASTWMEASFGLLRSDFSRKPAFVSIRNLLAVLDDAGQTASRSAAPGTADSVVDVPVTVSAAGSDVRQLVLRKADGRVDVVLWRAASLWNRDTRARQSVETVPVTVSYSGAVAGAQTFAPVESADGRPAKLNGGRTTLAVGAQPVVLEITPSAAPPVTPAPVSPAPPSAPPATPEPVAPAPTPMAPPVPVAPPPAPAPPAPTGPAAPPAAPSPTAPKPTPTPRAKSKAKSKSKPKSKSKAKAKVTAHLSKKTCRRAKRGSTTAKRCRALNRSRR
jgi:hypothetical protein